MREKVNMASRGLLAAIILVIATTFGVGAEDDAAFNPDDFRVGLEPIATGLNQPLYLTAASDGDGRMFVAEKGGTVRIVQEGQLLDTPFLDISDRVGSEGSEQGLLSIAFPPDYAESGLLYVDYTDDAGNTVVSRFTVTDDPNIADPASEEVILRQDQPFPNHNGGLLVFGPDGFLYIGLGDGGSQGDPDSNGQNLGTWLGKILRIDVDPNNTPDGQPYAVPDDNPFVDDDSALPEIWAYGLRNPWRYSFDRETDDFYVADVGGNQIEEVSYRPADEVGGDNFGWDIREGTACHEQDPCDLAGAVDPVTEYTHDFGCSVTGGYVYRGEAFPDLQG
ncbi:MAG: PQQ-dependent sugar dehydrogenase, partial [Chloroflexia bacterium]|nr:PQQ-dependent sugar dehydrogenase [Chloroflexia bacterium]